MTTLIPEISFEYDCGATTAITVGHCTRQRVVPATVCVSPVGSRSRIELDGKTFYVTAPDSFIIPRDAPHCITVIEGKDPIESIWCHIRINVFHDLDLLRFYQTPHYFTGAVATAFRQAILDLNAAVEAPPSVAQAFQQQYCGMKLANVIVEASELKDETVARLTDFQRLAPVLKFMQERLGQPVTLTELASVLNLSPSRFSGLFQQIVGQAPVAYFNRLRIRRAQNLLLNSGQSMSELAEQLGFYDVYHFSHRFKQTVGISPKQYRAQVMAGLWPET